MEIEKIDAEFAFKEVLKEMVDSKFDMSINWNVYKQINNINKIKNILCG